MTGADLGFNPQPPRKKKRRGGARRPRGDPRRFSGVVSARRGNKLIERSGRRSHASRPGSKAATASGRHLEHAVAGYRGGSGCDSTSGAGSIPGIQVGPVIALTDDQPGWPTSSGSGIGAWTPGSATYSSSTFAPSAHEPGRVGGRTHAQSMNSVSTGLAFRTSVTPS